MLLYNRIIRKFIGTKPELKKLVEGLVLGEGTVLDATVDIRKKGGSVCVGKGSSISGFLATDTEYSKIEIGNNVHIGGGSVLDCVLNIIIEDDVLIAYQCIIQDSDNHSSRYSLRKNDTSDWMKNQYHNWEVTPKAAVKICKGAWLGARAIILKGVTIGEGSIVGAGSVVTKDVAPWTVVAGNPAKIIREIQESER